MSLSEIIESLSANGASVGANGARFRVADLADSTFRQLDKVRKGGEG